MTINKPEPREDFYFTRYIKLSNESDLLSSLEASRVKTLKTLGVLDEEKSNYAYAEGKWTIKEVLAHCIDTERILSYRALCFSRNEALMLPGFDQDRYQEEDASNNRTLSELLEEYDLVRRSTMHLFKRMKIENIDFQGIASNVSISPRELGWTIAGHDLHHLSVIEDKYLDNTERRGSASVNISW